MGVCGGGVGKIRKALDNLEGLLSAGYIGFSRRGIGNQTQYSTYMK